MKFTLTLKTIIISFISTLIVGGIIGFFIGRSVTNLNITEEIIERPSIVINPPNKDSIIIIDPDPNIPSDIPENIIKPQYSYLAEYTSLKKEYSILKDSLERFITTYDYLTNSIKSSIVPEYINIDSLYIDYIRIRQSNNSTIFDNDYGKFKMSWKTQYNRTSFSDMIFTPKEHIITKISIPTFTPWISSGYNTARFINLGVGVNFNKLKLGVQYSYQFDLDKDKILNKETNLLIDRSGHTINLIKSF